MYATIFGLKISILLILLFRMNKLTVYKTRKTEQQIDQSFFTGNESFRVILWDLRFGIKWTWQQGNVNNRSNLVGSKGYIMENLYHLYLIIFVKNSSSQMFSSRLAQEFSLTVKKSPTQIKVSKHGG